MAILTSRLSNKKIAYFQYDFATHGGTAGAITVQGSKIPSGAIITSGMIHVNTAVVGTTSTLAIQALASEDILAATAEASLTLNAVLDTVPDQTAANAIRMTSTINSLTFTIGVNDLTAGKVTACLEYLEPTA